MDFYVLLPEETRRAILLLSLNGHEVHNLVLTKWKKWMKKSPVTGGRDSFVPMKGMAKYNFPGAYSRFMEMINDTHATYHPQTKLGSPKWCWYMAREWAEWEKVCPGFYAGTFSIADLLALVPATETTAEVPAATVVEEVELAVAVQSKLTILP
jgi:hypothetical protein